MKTLWNIVSFLAVVHLLALLGFVGWLWRSDRLSMDRVESIRTLFARTNREVTAEAEQAAEKARQEQDQAAAEARLHNPPVSSAVQIDLVSRIAEQASQAQKQMRDEHARLNARLAAAQADLAKHEEEFNTRKDAWLATEKAEQERKLSEQFAQVVKLLESIPAKLAKEKIRELVDTGKTDQAIAYLDAMNSRAAAAIMKEFKTADENRLATELLEKLRTFGVKAGVAEQSPDDSVAPESS